MNLHNDADTFSELLTSTAEATAILPAYIEKDYWLTTVLRELAQSPHRQLVVFNGGTYFMLSFNYHAE